MRVILILTIKKRKRREQRRKSRWKAVRYVVG